MSKKKKIIIAVISILVFIDFIIFIIAISQHSKTFSTRNNIDSSSDVQEERKNEYSKEQIISLLTDTKDENGMLMIIGLGDLRLRTELNYIEPDEVYLAKYNYKVYGDMINFYIIIPQEVSIGFYDISAYQASYTITEDTVNYFNDFDNSKNSVKRVDEIFKINDEHVIQYFSYASSATLNTYIAQAQEKASKILTYDPTGERQKQEAEKSKEKLRETINKSIAEYNKEFDWNFVPTDEDIEGIMKYFNYKDENFTDMEFYEYAFERDWFSETPPVEDGKDHSKSSQYEKRQTSLNQSNSSKTKSSYSSSENAHSETSSNSTSATTDNNKLSAMVRVKVYNTDSAKKYEYVGKNVKVMLNNETIEDSYFNGDNYTATFFNVSTSTATIKVYIDSNLVKTQEANLESLAKQGNYYTDVVVNI